MHSRSQTAHFAGRPCVHPGVTRVAIWVSLGVGGWAVVASVVVAGLRVLG